MSRSHYFYFKESIKELEALTSEFQNYFDEMIGDTFSDEEMNLYEKQLDSIAAVYVQPILSELSFDDFYSNEKQLEQQKTFFQSCRSSVCLENLPYFESHPFQVSYLLEWLEKFDEVLIDRGGVHELVFKSEYLTELQKYKNIDHLISSPIEKTPIKESSRPISPVDFLVQDIYKELVRLSNSAPIEVTSEKSKKLYEIMKNETLSPSEVLKKSGFIPKDFEDSLEKLKFTLKKIAN